jgi:hypothetical protein
MLLIGFLCLVAFWYLVRRGKLGEQVFTFEDGPDLVHTIHLDRGVLRDTLTVYENNRTDHLVYAYSVLQGFDQPKSNSHLDMADVDKYYSFRPIKATVITYDRAYQLEQKLRDSIKDRQLLEKKELNQIVHEFY